MNYKRFFIIGSVVGWSVLSSFTGGKLPLLSLQSILVIVIGGVLGAIIGAAIKDGWRRSLQCVERQTNAEMSSAKSTDFKSGNTSKPDSSTQKITSKEDTEAELRNTVLNNHDGLYNAVQIIENGQLKTLTEVEFIRQIKLSMIILNTKYRMYNRETKDTSEWQNARHLYEKYGISHFRYLFERAKIYTELLILSLLVIAVLGGLIGLAAHFVHEGIMSSTDWPILIIFGVVGWIIFAFNKR